MNEIVIADPSALAVHPAAALFPMLDERELAELASDIQANGLVSPIVVKDGEILDGRNRLRACELAGAAPRFVEWTGTGSITSWVFSVNLHRRHLTTSQRAMLAARAVDVFAHEAAQRMASGVHVEEEEKGKAREKVAEQLHVGDQSVLRAQQVLKHAAPELVAAVDAGQVAVAAAAEVAMLPPEAQRELVREKRVPERAREVREQRRPSPPPPPPLPPPRAAPPPPATTTAPTAHVDATPTPDVPHVGDDGGESAEEGDEFDARPSKPARPPTGPDSRIPIGLSEGDETGRRGDTRGPGPRGCPHGAPGVAMARHRVERGPTLGHEVRDPRIRSDRDAHEPGRGEARGGRRDLQWAEAGAASRGSVIRPPGGGAMSPPPPRHPPCSL